MENRFLKQRTITCQTRLLVLIACLCLFCELTAQTIEYRGATNVLFATSDSRLFANVIEDGDLIKVEALGIGYIHAGHLSFTLVYDTTKLMLTDNLFLHQIPFESSVPEAMELSPTLPDGYFIDVTQHAPTGGVTNMAYYKGGIGTMTYDKEKCWKVESGKVDKAFTLFLKKKVSGTPILSSDLGFYLSYLPKREPKWGIDNLVVGYKYGSGNNIFINQVFMNYANPDLFSFRWSSDIETNEVTNFSTTSATLSGVFERSKFNPVQDSITLIYDPYLTIPTVVPNTILDWDTITRYGFIYSDVNAQIITDRWSKKMKVDGVEYEITPTDISNGYFVRNTTDTFKIILQKNTFNNRTVSYESKLTNLEQGKKYYAWSFMYYVFETSEEFMMTGDRVEFQTLGGFTLVGTVFPFVHTENPVFDTLFPVTAKLYAYPSAIDCDDPAAYIALGTPLFTTKAVYYDGSVFVPNTPKYPGVIGATNNPGLPIRWETLTNEPVLPPNPLVLTKDDNLTEDPIGLYTFEEIPAADYLLVLSRPGFITRIGEITVGDVDTTYLGHRELVAGAVKNEFVISTTDASTVRGGICDGVSAPQYNPKYDMNGDGKVNNVDVQYPLLHNKATFMIYKETLDWYNAICK